MKKLEALEAAARYVNMKRGDLRQSYRRAEAWTNIHFSLGLTLNTNPHVFHMFDADTYRTCSSNS